jgi:LmbE family N-acetylglucosaminyl deacetylase
MPYADGELPVSEEAQWRLADAIREHRPTVLITHWKGSIHRDHRNTHLDVMEALYFAGLPAFRRDRPAWYPRAVYFAENWEDPYDFQPDVALDVTDVFPAYLDAIRAYELVRGGVSSFRYYDYYDALGTVRGAVNGFTKGVVLMRPEGSRLSRRDLLA